MFLLVTPYLTDLSRYPFRMRTNRTCAAESKTESLLRELEGFLEIGMLTEARELADQLVDDEPPRAKLFGELVDCLLRTADDLAAWEPIVVRAFSKLSPSGRVKMHRWMLWFYASCLSYKRAIEFVPPRFVGKLALVDLVFSMETLLALERFGEAGKLIPLYERRIATAALPEMRQMLKSVIEQLYDAEKNARE
jgi:hypothetical protein